MGPEHRGRWGRGLGLLWKQKLTTGHRILPQAPAGQHPLPAPGLPEGASAPGHARCCPLGQQASAGSLWGDRTSLTKTTCSPAPPPSISCPETQPLRLEKTSDLELHVAFHIIKRDSIKKKKNFKKFNEINHIYKCLYDVYLPGAWLGRTGKSVSQGHPEPLIPEEGVPGTAPLVRGRQGLIFCHLAHLRSFPPGVDSRLFISSFTHQIQRDWHVSRCRGETNH